MLRRSSSKTRIVFMPYHPGQAILVDRPSTFLCIFVTERMYPSGLVVQNRHHSDRWTVLSRCSGFGTTGAITGNGPGGAARMHAGESHGGALIVHPRRLAVRSVV